MSDELENLREQIDAVDRSLVELINERAKLALQVAQAKENSGRTQSYYHPEREALVVRNTIKHNQGPLSDREMARLIRETMSACLALQQPLLVAFLGPSGTFTEEAAHKHFGNSIRTVATDSIDDVFREVESDNADYGVVPIENSTQGIVNSTLDMFLESGLKIVGEVELHVRQHLMSKAAALSEVKTLYAHQQSLAQCKRWLRANLPEVAQVQVHSNAEAARRAAEEPDAAAIAGIEAAHTYQLTVLKRSIQDAADNTTRFLIIGKQQIRPTGADKTTLLVSAKNKPGALYSLLQPLAENNVSMTRIESRPSHCVNWEYVFFLDLDGHQEDDLIKHSLEALQAEAGLLKILGSYPKAVL